MADSDIAMFLSGLTPGASLGGAIQKQHPFSNIDYLVNGVDGTGRVYITGTNMPAATANVKVSIMSSASDKFKLSTDNGVTYGTSLSSVNNGDVLPAYAANGTDWIQGYFASTVSGLNESVVTITNTTANSLFDNIASGQNSPNPSSEYRCIYVYNASLVARPMSVYVSSYPTSTSPIALGKEAAVGDAAAVIASEAVAPAGIAFNANTSIVSPLALGTIAAQSYIGVWVRRTPPGTGAATVGDGFTISVLG